MGNTAAEYLSKALSKCLFKEGQCDSTTLVGSLLYSSANLSIT